MTPSELDEIKARLAAASPGPWKIHPRDTCFSPGYGGKEIDNDSAIKYGNQWVLGGEVDGLAECSRSTFGMADAWFVANSRQDIPALITALEQSWARIKELEGK